MPDTLDFLDAVFGAEHPGLFVNCWDKPAKTSASFEANADAAEWAAGKGDVYVTVSLTRQPTRPDKRVRNIDAAAIAGVHADIDVNGGPEEKHDAAPDEEEAIALARRVLEPTLLVHSGYGVQSWHLAEEGLWLLDTKAERDKAARVLKGWQARLQEQVPYRLDKTADLARLLRLPGTFNEKGGLHKPVVVLDADDDGPRYLWDTLRSEVVEVRGKAVTLDDLDKTLKLDPRATEPDKWPDVLANQPELSEVLAGTHPSVKGKSASEVDMTICHPLVRYGWSNQEITDLLIAGRRAQGSKMKDVQYYARTIAAARESQGIAERRERRQKRRNGALEELDTLGQDASDGHTAPDPDRVLHRFNELVGGPEVKELIQWGTDPDPANHSYRLVLADGSEVPLGPVTNLLNMDRFAERLTVVTGHVLEVSGDGIKAKWRNAIRALLTTRTISDDSDRTSIAHGMLRKYAQSAGTDRDQALRQRAPWKDEDKGMLWVYRDSFADWLRLNRYGIRAGDVPDYLRAAGAERKSLNYLPSKGASKHTSASYYGVALDDLDEGSSIQEDFLEDDS